MDGPVFLAAEIDRLDREYDVALEAYRHDHTDPLGWWTMKKENRPRRMFLQKILNEAAMSRQGIPESEFALLPKVLGVAAYAFYEAKPRIGPPGWEMRSALNPGQAIVTSSTAGPDQWGAVCEAWERAVRGVWAARQRPQPQRATQTGARVLDA